ncbi:MAG: DUF1822 family protein, partial [Leptolyngbya sp. SIO4C1]|nr:DUF1822 family protein [Leptolyngbya sp. SIO4C1]
QQAAIRHHAARKAALTEAGVPVTELPFSGKFDLTTKKSLKTLRRQQLYQRRQQITPVNLGRWSHQIFEQGWQTLESLLPQTSALRFRSVTYRDPVTVRGKSIYLNVTQDDAVFNLVLVLAVVVEADSRRNIRIQLYPSGERLLPSGTALALELPDTGEQLQIVRAGEQDNYIQLPPFRCPAERSFRVCIHLAEQVVYENFIS